MASVCFYFQVHQPYRLRDYGPRDGDPFYFDDALNQAILEKVAEKCYRPATQLILDLVRRHEGRFRVAYAITGTALEQMQRWAPDVVDLFHELLATGACELIAETSHHAMAFMHSTAEFDAQVERHRELMRTVFGVDPVTFRNTELVYSNHLADHVRGLGRFRAILCEGVDRLLAYRSPNYVYAPPGRLDENTSVERASSIGGGAAL